MPLDATRLSATGRSELLIETGYRGIFSAEFKLDSRCGTLRLLEINTRAWWYVEFAARCGVNVCQMAYQDALEQPVARSARSYPIRIGCVNLGGDIKAVSALPAADRLRWFVYLLQWLRSHFPVLRWDDPGPALSLMAPWIERARARLRRLRLSFSGRSRCTEADLTRSPGASAPPGSQ